MVEDEILVDVARRFGLAGRAHVARVIRGLSLGALTAILHLNARLLADFIGFRMTVLYF